MEDEHDGNDERTHVLDAEVNQAEQAAEAASVSGGTSKRERGKWRRWGRKRGEARVAGLQRRGFKRGVQGM
jgi:hypothetical protein